MCNMTSLGRLDGIGSLPERVRRRSSAISVLWYLELSGVGPYSSTQLSDVDAYLARVGNVMLPM